MKKMLGLESSSRQASITGYLGTLTSLP